MSSVLACFMIRASSSARTGSGLESSTFLKSWRFPNSYPDAIATDGDPNEPGTATLALSSPNRVENAHANPFEIPVNAFALYLGRQAVLRAHVFAAPAFEDQTHMNVRIARLFPMENWTAGSQVIAGIFAINAINRILA